MGSHTVLAPLDAKTNLVVRQNWLTQGKILDGRKVKQRGRRNDGGKRRTNHMVNNNFKPVTVWIWGLRASPSREKQSPHPKPKNRLIFFHLPQHLFYRSMGFEFCAFLILSGQYITKLQKGIWVGLNGSVQCPQSSWLKDDEVHFQQQWIRSKSVYQKGFDGRHGSSSSHQTTHSIGALLFVLGFFRPSFRGSERELFSTQIHVGSRRDIN